MRAIDTNILVYAVSERSAESAAAKKLLRELAEGSSPWAIPWPCIYEFLRVVTHPRVLTPPLTMPQALAALTALAASPSLVLLSETSEHMAWLDKAIAEGGAKGNLVYDARIVALCYEHGVKELISADADFRRFRGLDLSNPFERTEKKGRSRR